MNRHTFRPARRDGFTLLELIVAMTLVVIIAGSLAVSMRIAFKAQATSERAMEPVRTAELAFELLRNDLDSAVLPNQGLFSGTFTGTDGTDDRGHPGDDMLFYANSDAPQHVSGTGDIKKIELTITTAANDAYLSAQNNLGLRPDDHLLVRRITGNLLAPQDPTPDTEIICRGVSSFNVEYFDGSQWQDSWDSTQYNNALPTAVRVTLELDRPGGGTNGGTGPNDVLRYTRVFQLPMGVPASTTGATP